jgi:hypothetical protein
MDGVNAEIAEINDGVNSTNQDYIKNTLQDAYDNSTEISIMIKDSSTGKKVPVTVKLDELDFSNGKISAVLNNLHAPVESITNITKPQQAGDSNGSKQ